MNSKFTRRRFLNTLLASGAGAAYLTSGAQEANAFFRHRRLKAKPAPLPVSATTIDKFVNRLVNPLGDAPIPVLRPNNWGSIKLTIKQARQSLGLSTNNGWNRGPSTDVWGYQFTGSWNVGITNYSANATFPGPTIEAMRGTTTYLIYENGLQGVTFPANVPLDSTLDWASPGAVGGKSPIPVVAHLHGARTNTIPNDNGRSDGGPNGWATPGAAQTGKDYLKTYTYENTQEACFLWYHDHTLGITRSNVYMGLAGIYLLRDDNENVLRARTFPSYAPVLPSYPYEVPLVLQDRSFQTDGSLFYPSSTYPDPAATAPTPTHLPEFFGDVILVNATAWPRLDVEPRKYRFRILNGSDSRVYELSWLTAKGAKLPVLVIGNELGLLNTPVRAALPVDSPNAATGTDTLLIAPGERYDIIVDFASAQGQLVTVTNTGTTPYPGGTPPVAGTTDRVMAFSVTKRFNYLYPNATVALGTQLRGRACANPTPVLAAPDRTKASKTRKLFLFEGNDAFGRLQTMIGVVGPKTQPGTGTMFFSDPVTETPTVNTTEIWEIHNTTADAHPIHLHLVNFRILERQAITTTVETKVMAGNVQGAYLDPADIQMAGAPIPPAPFEAGRKDTVLVYPDQVVRILATFDRVGDFVYHCHILSHEDHEMMRPFKVMPPIV